MTELFKGVRRKWAEHDARPMSGWLALSPLPVFLCIYLISSIIAKDFYGIPISAAFLLASVYGICICRGKTLEQRIAVFSEGAGNKNVLLMIWIFILAGAFATTAKEIGAIDATVNLALRILPGRLLYAGLFLASCFISMHRQYGHVCAAWHRLAQRIQAAEQSWQGHCCRCELLAADRDFAASFLRPGIGH